MSVAVVADSHVSGPGGPAGPFVEQLVKLPGEGVEHLILLGDIFQAWVGFPHFETEDIRTVVETLTELGRRGLRIDYIEGNRDFYLQGSRYEQTFDRIALETTFEVDGLRYLCVHGDGLDDDDRQYRRWRALSKSWPVRTLVRGLPGPLARRFVASTERRLGDTNFKHKQRIPREAIERYAVRRLAEGYDRLLLGHFHEARRWTVEGGEVEILEAWFTSGRVERFGIPLEGRKA
ncbi:MAG: UDP-2,3-diacylglucosamine diphosphatase [Thermoanaerobaculia bacterium]|nr:UDP-2,3-diacylglucosamine diphosphatase [Thermoanaerobaculia bacterium]